MSDSRPLKANERKVRAKVPVELTELDLKKGDDEIAACSTQIEEIENEAKEVATGYRKSVKDLKAKRRTLLEERKTGKRYTEQDCVEAVYPTHKATYYPHPDAPGALKISEQPLTEEEIASGAGAAPLFDETAKKKGPKAKGPKTKKPGGASASATAH